MNAVVRLATEDDLGAIHAVQVASARSSSAAMMRDVAETIVAPDRLILVATVDDAVVGWAKTHHWRVFDDDAPAGHYLSGVTVTPVARRLGIGTLLTQPRIDWIAERADEAFYETSTTNEASIALHGRWGFREIARGTRFHGVQFQNVVILMRADLHPPADGA